MVAATAPIVRSQNRSPYPTAQPQAPTPAPAPAPAPAPGAMPAYGSVDWAKVQPGESADAYYKRTGIAGYGQSGAQLYAAHNNLNDPNAWMKATFGDPTGKSPQELAREQNLYQANLQTAQNIQNSYNTPVGQRVAQAAAALGPNAGEKAIQQWMAGGPIDYGLAANSINAQFNLGQLMGSSINNYMAGGGTAQVPVDFGGGMFGWTKDANGNYIAPQGDQSGITWNPTTHRFEGDLDKATQYYMKGMIAGNGLQGSAGTLNHYVNPQGQTWTGTQWVQGNQAIPYMTADRNAWNAAQTGVTPGAAQPGAPGAVGAGGGAVNNSMNTSNTTPFNIPGMGSFDPNSAYKFAGMDANYVDPGFAFRLGVGNDLLQNSAAAKGNLQSGATLKAIQQYGQDMASQEAQNAYNRFSNNRQFNYGVDVGDRDFAAQQANLDRQFQYNAEQADRQFGYNAQQADRAFNYGTLRDMMQFGLQGTGAEADTQRLLATLLSQNALSMGQTQGAGTVGGSNAINNAISQFLQQYLGGQYLNRAFPQTG